MIIQIGTGTARAELKRVAAEIIGWAQSPLGKSSEDFPWV